MSASRGRQRAVWTQTLLLYLTRGIRANFDPSIARSLGAGAAQDALQGIRGNLIVVIELHREGRPPLAGRT